MTGAAGAIREREPEAGPREVIRRGRATSARTVLLIAFHYPPCQESSGYLRALAFSRDLPEFGWNPVVLTASTRAYSRTDEKQCARIPESVPVVRAFARDAREHLSFRRRYPSLLAVPDRCSSWMLGAVPAGLTAIRRYRPKIIWATQPNPTAFCVAHALHRLTGLPWIADFRDPISVPDDNRWAWRACRWIERKTVYGCSRAVFTAPGAASLHAGRYPDIPMERWTVIPNGYDESDFDGLASMPPVAGEGPLRLVHSGALYTEGRDPQALFAAIAGLKASQGLSGRDLQIILRATEYDEHHLALIRRAGIDDIVRVEPAVSHQEALAEICGADGLLILQGRMHNGQIPAKVYEYLRARRPILALTDEASDTAKILREAGINSIVSMDHSDAIAAVLANFMSKIRMGVAPIASSTALARHSRKARAQQLADVLNEVSDA